MKKRDRLITRPILIIAILMMVSGCGIGTTPQDSSNAEEVVNKETSDALKEIDEETLDEDAEPEEKQKTDLNRTQGYYIGHADANSIEVRMEKGEHEYKVFRLSAQVQQKMEQEPLEPNAPVTINYTYTEHGQPEIIEISN